MASKMGSNAKKISGPQRPRCIWATRFEKTITRSFLIVHEAIVTQQSTVSRASYAMCLEVERGEGTQ
jgi:hypothetical protein